MGRAKGATLSARTPVPADTPIPKRKRIYPPTKPKQLIKLIHHKYKMRAHKSGMRFSLSADDFGEIIIQNCVYCGSEPKQSVRVSLGQVNRNGDMLFNGVDRINNLLGYVKGNVAACCGTCNKMKGTKSREDFLWAISAIVPRLVMLLTAK